MSKQYPIKKNSTSGKEIVVGFFMAISANIVKMPSERNLAGHLFYIRELID